MLPPEPFIRPLAGYPVTGLQVWDVGVRQNRHSLTPFPFFPFNQPQVHQISKALLRKHTCVFRLTVTIDKLTSRIPWRPKCLARSSSPARMTSDRGILAPPSPPFPLFLPPGVLRPHRSSQRLPRMQSSFTHRLPLEGRPPAIAARLLGRPFICGPCLQQTEADQADDDLPANVIASIFVKPSTIISSIYLILGEGDGLSSCVSSV